MTVFTSTLPRALLDKLNFYAIKFKLPKNKILEKALEDYLNKLKKAEYIHSFKTASQSEEIVYMAEEGLDDYLKVLDE